MSFPSQFLSSTMHGVSFVHDPATAPNGKTTMMAVATRSTEHTCLTMLTVGEVNRGCAPRLDVDDR
jgi:hypothetical protein